MRLLSFAMRNVGRNKRRSGTILGMLSDFSTRSNRVQMSWRNTSTMERPRPCPLESTLRRRGEDLSSCDPWYADRSRWSRAPRTP
jgi:hypothetical protein